MDERIWVYNSDDRAEKSFEDAFVESKFTAGIKRGISSDEIAVEDPTNIEEYENISVLTPKYQGPNTWTQENKISKGDIFLIFQDGEYRYFSYVLFTAVDENGYFSEEVWQYSQAVKKNLLCLSKPIEIRLTTGRVTSLFGYEKGGPTANLAPGMASSPSDTHQRQFRNNCSDITGLIDEVAVRNISESVDEESRGKEDDRTVGVSSSASNTNRTDNQSEAGATPDSGSVNTDYDTEQQELKREALADATENPSKDIIPTSQRSDYSRSEKIKRFVLARADGTCEGCGRPAPFDRKDGSPYLEVHHLDELAEGGADAPDNVVALCPNCHCQIHYGKNGTEYNDDLRKKLEKP
ncbi:HNH endonuclease [Haloarcula onubensis]|uniref:HNH endonuclease n=1 Tax=Haloarcula onubensis TaxID=2950539 RepID=A0ABU2FTF4_9EURY|nr:HNH endonuclease [Halomicroarcula sp. S3CR25-11]MDS0284030.1 HNH endonuclease [Halomicroarcula sp. S3CR25-11]